MLETNRLFFGGDYNPEQWPKDVWKKDIELMQKANVNLVSLGIFSWANLEKQEGVYTFDFLDEAMDLLHSGGISVDLATATASPPAWLTRKYPEVLPVSFSGVRLAHGGRQAYCASSSVYQERSVALASEIAKRYADHPALVMWHVNNEYGCHAPYCYCENSRQAFLSWLRKKYSSLDELNLAWGTDFWSQRYHQWDEISVPKQTPDGTHPNPAQQLDFRRFASDETLKLFVSERDAIRQWDRKNPITTNFMSLRYTIAVDYFKWAKEVDFVSTDHYLIQAENDNHIDLAQMADLTRGFAQGENWLLMEHSTSAVNWQERNYAKTPGQELRNAMSFIGRGSQGAMYFQWRQSQAGSERFHSAMVPHAGEDTSVFREVSELGEKLSNLADLANFKTKQAKVAIVFDYEQAWALSQANLPTQDLNYPQTVASWYKALYNLGVRADFVSAEADPSILARYEVIFMPLVHMLSAEEEAKFANFLKSGGRLVISYFSNIADRNLRVKLGGYGGSLIKDLMGVRVEEFYPLRNPTKLSNGYRAGLWSELSQVTHAEVIASFQAPDAPHGVAISKAKAEAGVGWYLATELVQADLEKFFGQVLEEAAIETPVQPGTEEINRGPYKITISHDENSVSVTKI